MAEYVLRFFRNTNVTVKSTALAVSHQRSRVLIWLNHFIPVVDWLDRDILEHAGLYEEELHNG